MKHLTDHQILSVAENSASSEAQAHTASCERCATAVDRTRALLVTLADSSRSLPSPPTGLMRWARAYVDVAGKTERRASILELLACGAAPVAGVRNGVASGTAALYGDACHQLDLRVEPRGDGMALHGQVIPVDDSELQPWQVLFMMADGETHETTTDEYGEFTIEGLESWVGASVVLDDASARLVVPSIGRSDRREGQK